MIETNDSLLVKMIEQDMLQRGIAASDYVIVSDESYINPKLIELKSNEAVYVCFFMVNSPINIPFLLTLTSASTSQHYSSVNTKRTETTGTIGTNFNFESPAVSSHWSSITFEHNLPLNAHYVVRTIRIIYSTTKEENEV